MELSRNIESKEFAPELLFKVTLMRHEEPFYKDEGHDLTPRGVEGAINTGKRFKEEGIIGENDDIHLVHSPTLRAKGTLDFVAEGAGLKDKPKIAIKQLRKSDMLDTEILKARYRELELSQEKIAEDHHKNPLFEDHPEVIEPHSHKKERLYRTFEYLIRWFEKHPAEGKTPHVIAVSHYELITHIVDDVFGMENIGKYNAPAFGEAIYIEAYATEAADKVRLKVTYDNISKEVLFDRENRTVEHI